MPKGDHGVPAADGGPDGDRRTEWVFSHKEVAAAIADAGPTQAQLRSAFATIKTPRGFHRSEKCLFGGKETLCLARVPSVPLSRAVVRRWIAEAGLVRNRNAPVVESARARVPRAGTLASHLPTAPPPSPKRSWTGKASSSTPSQSFGWAAPCRNEEGTRRQRRRARARHGTAVLRPRWSRVKLSSGVEVRAACWFKLQPRTPRGRTTRWIGSFPAGLIRRRRCGRVRTGCEHAPHRSTTVVAA